MIKELKEKLIEAMKYCINSYGGEYGTQELPKSKYVKKFRVQNVDAQLYYNDYKECMLVITGSNEDGDWTKNLNCKSKKITEKIEVHEGLYYDHIILWNKIISELDKFKKIDICGHSKGGAQSGLMTFFLSAKYKDEKQIEGIGFGMPKFICKEAAQKVYNFISVINGEDYITKLPQWKFAHMGNVINIGHFNILLKIPFIRGFGVLDHYPQKYIKHLREIKTGS